MSERHATPSLEHDAIVGIGATEFSKDSGRSELRLAVEACEAALADAGIEPAEVDGMVTFSADTNPEIEIARNLGIGELTFFSRIHHGGGAACGTIQQAALAVDAGRRRLRRLLPRLQRALGQPLRRRRAGPRPDGRRPRAPTSPGTRPYGLLTPAQWVAMFAQRYMHEYGATSEDFGRVAVADRKHAATNPKAWFYEQPITLEDHQESRWIVEPLHLLDCCQETDGGQALVVTTLERARDLPKPPVVIAGRRPRARATDQEMMTSYYRDDHRPPRDGRRAPASCGSTVGPRSRRHPDRVHLRPLHAARAPPARGVRVLRPGRGEGLHPRRQHRARRAAARSTPTAASSARPTSTA